MATHSSFSESQLCTERAVNPCIRLQSLQREQKVYFAQHCARSLAHRQQKNYVGNGINRHLEVMSLYLEKSNTHL